MGGERFDAEGFGRVVPPENKIDAKLFRSNCRPVRRLAGDERVDLFPRHAMNFAARCAGDDADRLRFLRTEVERLDPATERFFQSPNELTPRNSCARLYADQLTFLLKEWRC